SCWRSRHSPSRRRPSSSTKPTRRAPRWESGTNGCSGASRRSRSSCPRVTRSWSAAKMWSRHFSDGRLARRFLRTAGGVLLALLLAGCASGPSPAPQGSATAEVPAAVRARYEQALAAMTAGDLTEAELLLETFVLEYPDYPGAH